MVVVQPYERALHYRRGVFLGVLGPGRHRLRGLGHEVVDVDLRSRLLSVGAQEVPTSDGIRVKAGAALEWRVVDPRAWHEVAQDPESTLYEAGRLAVRDVVATFAVDAIPAGPSSADVPTTVQEAAAAVGVEVTSFRVTDVILPAEIRRAAESLVVARRRAQTVLEEARAQTAAVRNLANVADVLDAHPALAALRLAETAAAAGGSIVIERPAAP